MWSSLKVHDHGVFYKNMHSENKIQASMIEADQQNPSFYYYTIS